jgi:hypothetical protein
MTFEFTAAGRWYLRNERGQIVSKHFDSFEELLNSL